MRYFGWILGGLYAVDGLVALVGGRRMMESVSYTHLTLPTTPYV